MSSSNPFDNGTSAFPTIRECSMHAMSSDKVVVVSVAVVAVAVVVVAVAVIVEIPIIAHHSHSGEFALTGCLPCRGGMLAGLFRALAAPFALLCGRSQRCVRERLYLQAFTAFILTS